MTNKITADQLSITTSNHIVLDGVQTDYRVVQTRAGTIVYKGDLVSGKIPKASKLVMPHAWYSTSWDGKTDAGNPGREEFYRDVKAAISAHEKASA